MKIRKIPWWNPLLQIAHTEEDKTGNETTKKGEGENGISLGINFIFPIVVCVCMLVLYYCILMQIVVHKKYEMKPQVIATQKGAST